jgi:xylitol oxidase
MADQPMTNWAGTHRFTPSAFARPGSIDELSDIVEQADQIRAIGSGHSFTDIADAATMVDLSKMPDAFAVGDDRATVTVGAHVTYAKLFELLEPEGLALANTASLPHITVAGAVMTGTHGSGDDNGNLATAVAGISLVTADGSLLRLERGDPDFPGAVISLGALGLAVSVTLDVVATYDLKQFVVEDLTWETLIDDFDSLFASGYSVSVFHRFGSTVEQLWVKQSADAADVDPAAFGGVAAPVARHPVRELSADACTTQLGAVGPWSRRLPHFRPDAVAASGEEIQSEYFVDRRHGPAAVEALRSVADRLAPPVLAAEIRTVAADDLWLSPQCGRPTVAFHFSWVRDPETAARAAAIVEDALEPFDAVPHWGKLYTEARFVPADRYEHFARFLALRDRLDPDRSFTNRWTEQALSS